MNVRIRRHQAIWHSRRLLLRIIPLVAVVTSIWSWQVGTVYASNATIVDRAMTLSNSAPSAVADYELSMTPPVSVAFGSIKVEFCSNTTLFELSCTPPTGFDASSAVLASQAGDMGFSIHPASDASTIILTRTPAAGTGVQSTYSFTTITNADAEGTQYIRLSTYPTADASGPMQDFGGIAYSLNNPFGLTSEVPPNLEFCLATVINSVDCSDINGSYVELGDFSTNAARSGTLQMVAATNASNGYNLSVDGNTLASGNNPIPALTVPTVSAPGNSQFGINLRANSNPADGQDPSGPGTGVPSADYNQPNRYVFRSGDVVASKNSPDSYRKYTITYLVNISRSQTAGIYAGSYTYVALGNF